MLLPVVIIDAFTEEPFTGNPAAVIYNADKLDGATMQGIATRLGLPETVFTTHSSCATVKARYFTPHQELAMAGHPSIAVAHDLVERGGAQPGTTITLETQAGIIPISIANAHVWPRYTMEQRAPDFGARVDARAIASALALESRDVLLQPQIVSTGSPMLLVPLVSLDALERIIPDHHALFAQCQSRFVAIHCFARSNDNPFAFVCRNFGPPEDLPEDPATGSAIGPMSAFALANRLISHPTFLVSQGVTLGRPSRIFARVHGTADSISSVDIGGSAMTNFRSSIVLQSTS